MTVAGVTMLGFRLMGYVNVFVIIAPTMLLLFAIPLIFNNAFAGAFQPFPHIAGMAGALFASISILGGAISSSILALIADESQYPIAFVILVCALTAHLVYYMLNKRRVDNKI
jgi:fucose permease